MKYESSTPPAPVLYLPHGGGPLPLLGDKGHKAMVDFLREITPTFPQPEAIVVISAHWEETEVTITHGEAPSLIYDYYGFPEETYHYKYAAPGAPTLAERIFHLLQKNAVKARLDDRRGFDHGMFVPLKIMYPEATVPCVQVSLLNNLSAEAHLQIGKALTELRHENILIIGSGFSFHNLQALLTSGNSPDPKNEAFQDWLRETCTNPDMSPADRERRLLEWEHAPFARYCHPREEHLLPLHVCYGIAGSTATLVFDGKVLGKRACAFLW